MENCFKDPVVYNLKYYCIQCNNSKIWAQTKKMSFSPFKRELTFFVMGTNSTVNTTRMERSRENGNRKQKVCPASL